MKQNVPWIRRGIKNGKEKLQSTILRENNSDGSGSSKTKIEKWFELGFPEEKIRSTCISTVVFHFSGTQIFSHFFAIIWSTLDFVYKTY